jgi:hypothetical protein
MRTFFNGTFLRNSLMIFIAFSLFACGGGSSKKRTPASNAAVSSGASVNSATNSSNASVNNSTSVNNSASAENNSSKVNASTTSAASSKLPSGLVLMGGTIQGIPLNLTKEVTTLAGVAPGSDGTGITARFIRPANIVSDGTYFYASDKESHTIRKIVIATNVVTTFAGANGESGITNGASGIARFNAPEGLSINGGNLYVADSGNHTIRKIVLSSGEVSSFAGTAGMPGVSEGTTTAKFRNPTGITNDGTNLYVTDKSNHTIRQIVLATGVVSTLTGIAGTPGSATGAAGIAQFNEPSGITNDGTNLYVADKNNNAIRKILISTKVTSPLAGDVTSPGKDNGIGINARFNKPTGITINNMDLYVTDSSNHTIRKVTTGNGTVTTIAGKATFYGGSDGIGDSAGFNFPEGIVVSGGNLFIADKSNQTIRKLVTSTATVTTIAGASKGIDGLGAAASLSTPYSTTTDGTYLYVGDTDNQTIRKMLITTGEVFTVAGKAGEIGGDDGTGVDARFYVPAGITTDGTKLYVADANNNTIRQITIATGEVITLAGTAGVAGSEDKIGADARFKNPYGITTDGTNLYVADTGNSTIRKIVIASRAVTTIAGAAGNPSFANGKGTAARFNGTYAITTDGANLYIADGNNSLIRKMVLATEEVTTLAGKVGVPGSNDGIGDLAAFNTPAGITTDGTNLYVSDANNYLIRKIVIATKEVITLAGTAGVSGSANGTGTAARFNLPVGITSDGFNLYIGDSANNSIRKIH